MLFHSTSSQAPPKHIKQETYNFPLHATPAAHNVGAVRRDSSRFAENHRLLPFNYTASSVNEGTPIAIAMPPQKRPASGEPEAAGAKQHIKAEHPEEFSNAVKKRLASSSRTGQACDRCKVRKIRCDGLPGGCSPCLQNNTECFTTDRITGRATSRGYVEGIEQQNRDLQHRIRELEQQVIQAGGDIKSSNGYHGGGHPGFNYNPPTVQAPTWNSTASSYTPQTAMTTQDSEANMFRALPAFRAGCPGDNYLGVSPGNSNLSSIKGTALSILGMEIDIADFDSIDMDEPDPSSVFNPQLYNKSYQAFLQSALNINHTIEKVELPPRQEGMTYAQWYFRALNPYMPLLHRPTFFKLLTRFYDDPTFRPTVAETVIVHMVFATMFFQYAVRNPEATSQQAAMNHQSNLHYHYSLGMFYQLSCSHTVQDVQALTLICSHLRNFPKPGASWMLTQTTLAVAIELGLHRSAKRWAAEAMPNPLDVEMRKRIFWSVLMIHVTLGGKLGRPMGLRFEDFDVEMPEPLDDELLSENGLDTSRPGKCSHEIGLQAIRLLPLYMELYCTIYAVRRQPDNYVSTINSLEAKLRTWKEGLPKNLVKGEAGHNDQEGRVFALYAQIWALEFRLLLRHPSVSMTTDTSFNAESMRVCVESSRQMLSVVRKLQKYKSLDTTWYNSAVYVMAITTTLFAQWEKRGETSAADLAALREEMDIWLDIMGDVGILLGSGGRLREAVRIVTDGTLGLLGRSLPAGKNTNYSPHAISKSPTVPNGTTTYTPATHTYAYDNNPPSNGNNSSASTYIPTDSQLTHQQTPYPAATQYSTYQDAPSTIAYTPQDNTHAYAYGSSTSDSVDAPLLAAFAATAQAHPHSHSHTQSQNSSWQNSASQQTNSTSQAWQQWTNTMTTSNLEPSECYSANALMQLGGGGHDLSKGNAAQVSGSMGDLSTGQHAAVNQLDHSVGNLNGQVNGGMGEWPLNIFDIGRSA